MSNETEEHIIQLNEDNDHNNDNIDNCLKDNDLDISESPVICETQTIEPNITFNYQYYYDWNNRPKLINKSINEFNNCQLDVNKKFNNYLKGCKWSSDGSCLLTNSEDHCLRLFNLPQVLCNNHIVLSEEIEELNSVLKIKESELIYDYCWYPKMNSCDPSTCLILSTSRDNPIHLWDAYTGQLVCTYRAYNYADEVIAANSIAFNIDGTKIYCGFEKTLRVFDSSSPGRQCLTKATFEYKEGQKGIISTIAVNPMNPNILAVGSYDKSIGLYEEPLVNNMCVLVGQKGGLTHLKFSSDGNRLYSGGRKDSEILCWDIRNIGQILHVIDREVKTNQRIYFDLSIDCKYLVTGNENGFISVYDISSDIISDDLLNPITTFEAHNDCVNGVSFHPTLPLLGSASGQRQIVEISDNDNEDLFYLNQTNHENNLKLWWICSNHLADESKS